MKYFTEMPFQNNDSIYDQKFLSNLSKKVKENSNNKFEKFVISQILNFPKIDFIDPTVRMEVRNWIIHKCASNYLSKETTAHTCLLIDLSLANEMKIAHDQLPEFAVSCLRLAIKLFGCLDRPINVGKVDIKVMNRFETDILQLLNFDIYKKTYYHVGQQLIHLWVRFQHVSQEFYESFEGLTGSFNMVYFLGLCASKQFPAHLLFEILSFAFDFPQTLKLDRHKLVYNGFYFILCTQVYNFVGKVSDGQFEKFYSDQSPLFMITGQFGKLCKSHFCSESFSHDFQMQKYFFLLYNGLLNGFYHKIFKRDDIKETFNPDHQMWRVKHLEFTQTYFFDKREDSFIQLKDQVTKHWNKDSSFFQDQKQLHLLSTPGTKSTLSQRQFNFEPMMQQ